MKDLVTASSQIEGVATRKDGTIKITIGTQELPPEDGAVLLGLNQRQGYFAFAERPVRQEDFIDVPDEVKVEKTDKSQAERLRSTLYVLWGQLGAKGNFDDFYRQRMEQIIELIKEKLHE